MRFYVIFSVVAFWKMIARKPREDAARTENVSANLMVITVIALTYNDV